MENIFSEGQNRAKNLKKKEKMGDTDRSEFFLTRQILNHFGQKIFSFRKILRKFGVPESNHNSPKNTKKKKKKKKKMVFLYNKQKTLLLFNKAKKQKR